MLNLGDIVFISTNKLAIEYVPGLVGKIVRIPTKLCADYDVEIVSTTLTFSEQFLTKTSKISYLLYWENRNK